MEAIEERRLSMKSALPTELPKVRACGRRLRTPSLNITQFSELTKLGLYVQSGFSHTLIQSHKIKVSVHYSSIETDRCLLKTGNWYFEATLLELPTPQEQKSHATFRDADPPMVSVGFGDVGFFGDSIGGKGVGDDNHAWGLDHLMKLRHGGTAFLPVGLTSGWKINRTIGCSADLDKGIIWFYYKGDDGERMAIKGWENIAFVGGLKPMVSVRAKTGLSLNFGEQPFVLGIPEECRSVHQWLLAQQGNKRLK
eukprot:TRINITY_DN21661_c0_g1_i1.p2 TRINITY_DN21661_c0_g1~~TRINITY_DN21661_c0_g1_i1.p2  ORF type:complete len:253 (-),score=50.99 TRINITY_DN21661_c0_g1_i1:131-889(-)